MFICQRCGRCCRELVGNDFWKESKLNDEQKDFLVDERKNYAANEKGCDMLIFENGLAACFVQKIFGIEAKPDNCVNYPKERHKTCLREKENV